MKVLLLGAGASAATLGDSWAPVSKDFGNVLNARHSDWRDRFPFLRSAVDYLQVQCAVIDDWPLDAVWNGIDENFKLSGVIANNDFQWPSPSTAPKNLYRQYAYPSWQAFWILAGWELRRALAEVYGMDLEPYMNETHLGKKWLSQQIKALEDQDIIASTNYDLLTENIVRLWWPSAQNCRTYVEFRNRKATQGPLILKLHGSLDWLFRSNWITRKNCVDRSLGGRPIRDDEIDLDLRNYWETRPLIVAPVRYKDEIVFPEAQPTELVEVLNFQWQSFISALSKADELRVLGYRFPAEDSYGNRMLQEAMRRRPNDSKLSIRLYLPNEPPASQCQTVKTTLEKDILHAAWVEVECRGRMPADC